MMRRLCERCAATRPAGPRPRAGGAGRISALGCFAALAVTTLVFAAEPIPGIDLATGYRIGNYRAPVPAAVPGGNTVSTREAQALVARGAVLLDVLAARGGGPDPLDGAWRLTETHDQIPGSTWLPDVGTGTLDARMTRYFKDNLARLAGPPPGERPLLIYCQANCWMSWNASRRAILWGYRDVHWYPLGTDGWRDAGLALAPAPAPPPVDMD